LGPADPIYPEATQVLKRLDSGAGAVAEHAIGVDGYSTLQYGGQPTLDVRDRSPGVAEGDGQAYR